MYLLISSVLVPMLIPRQSFQLFLGLLIHLLVAFSIRAEESSGCLTRDDCVEVVLLERLWPRAKAFSSELAARFLLAHGLSHHVDVFPSRRAKAEIQRGKVDMVMFHDPSEINQVVHSRKPVMEGILAVAGRKNDERFKDLRKHLPDMIVASFHGDELLAKLAPDSDVLSVQTTMQAMELLDRGRVDIVFEYSALRNGVPLMEGFEDDKHQIMALDGTRQLTVRFQENVSGRFLRDAFDQWLEGEARSGTLYDLYLKHDVMDSFPEWARPLQGNGQQDRK